MAGDFSINEELMLEGSLSASLVCMTSIDSVSWFVSWIKKFDLREQFAAVLSVVKIGKSNVCINWESKPDVSRGGRQCYH